MSEPRLPIDYAAPDVEGHTVVSNWPTWVYVLALIWALLTLSWQSAAMNGYRDEIRAESRTQIPLLALATMRLVWARRRREQSKGWIFYVTILFLAVPIWGLVAPPLRDFGMRVAMRWWGGPLFP